MNCILATGVVLCALVTVGSEPQGRQQQRCPAVPYHHGSAKGGLSTSRERGSRQAPGRRYGTAQRPSVPRICGNIMQRIMCVTNVCSGSHNHYLPTVETGRRIVGHYIYQLWSQVCGRGAGLSFRCRRRPSAVTSPLVPAVAELAGALPKRFCRLVICSPEHSG